MMTEIKNLYLVAQSCDENYLPIKIVSDLLEADELAKELANTYLGSEFRVFVQDLRSDGRLCHLKGHSFIYEYLEDDFNDEDYDFSCEKYPIDESCDEFDWDAYEEKCNRNPYSTNLVD